MAFTGYLAQYLREKNVRKYYAEVFILFLSPISFIFHYILSGFISPLLIKLGGWRTFADMWQDLSDENSTISVNSH